MGSCISFDTTAVREPTEKCGVLVPDGCGRGSDHSSSEATTTHTSRENSRGGGEELKGGEIAAKVKRQQFSPQLGFGNVNFIEGDLFFAFIQQKARKPNDWILYDIRPKLAFNQLHLKFAIHLEQPQADSDNRDHRLQHAIKNKKILLYTERKGEPSSSNFEESIAFLKTASVAEPHSVYVLDEDFDVFCEDYPQCRSDSTLSLPGPVEIFTQPKGFSLYQGDVRTIRTNHVLLREFYDIRLIINLSGDSFNDVATSKRIEICSLLKTEQRGTGFLLKAAVELISKSCKAGLPVLIVDSSGRLAGIACAWFLVEQGVDVDNSMEYIRLKKDCTSGINDMVKLDNRWFNFAQFDKTTQSSLSKLASSLRSGIDLDQSRNAAIEMYPVFNFIELEK